MALLATTVAGFGAAALVFAPQADLFGTSAQAQNLTDKVQQLAQRPVGFADIVEKVKPAVISVRVKIGAPGRIPLSPTKTCRSRPARRSSGSSASSAGPMAGRPGGKEVVTGQGSGFFISADGYAVTNNHVVQNAETVTVTTDDGKTYTAKVIGTDSRSDLALIKVDGARLSLRETGRHFAAHRRLGARGRQSVRPRRHRDRGHRLGARPRYRRRSL